jgi:hypothetical protein
MTRRSLRLHSLSAFPSRLLSPCGLKEIVTLLSKIATGLLFPHARNARHSLPPRLLTQFFCQFPGQIRDVRLDHRRSAALQFAFERTHHVRVVVPQGVNAISREKINDASAVRGEQLRSETALVAHIHLEQVQKSYSLRIDPLGVSLRGTTSPHALEKLYSFVSADD